MDGDEVIPSASFTSESFTARREPMGDLINTFSDLYIDSDEESERAMDNVPEDDSFFFLLHHHQHWKRREKQNPAHAFQLQP